MPAGKCHWLWSSGYLSGFDGQHCGQMTHHRGTAIHHRGTEGSSGDLTYDVLGAAIEVHRRLGPGLLESAYKACLSRELRHRNIAFERQAYLPLRYRDMDIKCGYRLDMLVAKSVIVEVKAVSKITPLHVAQMLTYLKLTDLRLGLIINFNVEVLRLGVRRIVSG